MKASVGFPNLPLPLPSHLYPTPHSGYLPASCLPFPSPTQELQGTWQGGQWEFLPTPSQTGLGSLGPTQVV